MPNEMIRPLRLKDAASEVLIDAEQVTEAEASNGMLTIEHKYQEHLHFENMTDKAIMQYFWHAIAEALNPPIKVTQAVLEAIEKVPNAKFTLIDMNGVKHEALFDAGGVYFNYYKPEYVNVSKRGSIAYCPYIQADCPLALQVLLQFTLDGMRIKECG